MKKLLSVIILFISILIISCNGNDDPFLITENRVGPLDRDVQINELETVFEEDSVVSAGGSNQRIGEGAEIEIYDQSANLLLVLQPTQQFDSTSTIGNIQIIDPRYKTKNGLNVQSTFGDIVENYSISRIENTLSSAVVFIDEINAYITIDKKELPSHLRFDTDTKIEASQIPNDATFKYFMIGWD